MTLTVSAFELDATEVTVSQYAACVAAGGCAQPHEGDPKVNDKCHRNRPEEAELPVNCITWDMADSYCRFVGKRLPTDAEWEKAARGGDGRTYPWGEASPSCELANYAPVASRFGAAVAQYCVGGPTPVGSYPEGTSPYGIVDMSGNVWEWTADWFDSAHTTRPDSVDPRGPPEGSQRIVRGGAWDFGPDSLRAYNQGHFPPTEWHNFIGVRCAR